MDELLFVLFHNYVCFVFAVVLFCYLLLLGTALDCFTLGWFLSETSLPLKWGKVCIHSTRYCGYRSIAV